MKAILASKLVFTFKWLSLVSMTAAVVACGGGGSSSTTLTVRGTAAIGKALDGALVTVTCTSGTGSATSNSDGSYTVSITDGKGPCILTATKGATVLRSVAPGAGVINITPLTDMLIDYLATRTGTTAENLLNNIDGKAILSDTKALAEGQASVINLIKTTFGVSLEVENFLTATITPQTGSTAQNAADKDLDLLKTNNVVTSTGTPAPNVIETVKTEAAKAPRYVANTGASG